MPTYQFEAMDQTGQEIKDVIEATNQEEAQATIQQMGYFVTKISVKKSRKTAAAKTGRPQRQNLRHRRGQVEDPDHLHPPALDPARRRPAHPAQPENPRTAGDARRVEKLPDRRLRRDRRRLHALRGHGQVPQGLQPALRQHDQGRRGGRCAGSHSQAPGRVPRAVRIASNARSRARWSTRSSVVIFAVRHPGLHHVEDRARVRENLQGLRHRPARP